MHSQTKAYINLISVALLVSVTVLLISSMNDESTFYMHKQNFITHQGARSVSFKYNVTNVDKPFGTESVERDIHRPVRTRSLYPFSKVSYKLNNPYMCKSVTKVSCLIIVHTAPDHLAHRLGLRRTWANTCNYSPHNVRIAFLLGTVTNSTLQGEIERESKLFNDIVQGDFIDSYRNLTHKGVMGYRWITQYCRNAEVILKTDDDAVINLFKFFEAFYPVYRNYKKTIWCNRIDEGTMPIIRQKNSKWFVKPDQFKNYTMYPAKYCSGFALFMTPDLVRSLYQAALGTPFFWVDDFFLYGWLPTRIRNVTYHNFRGNLSFQRPDALKCYQQKKSNCEFLVFPSKPHDIDEMWEAVVKDRIKSKNWLLKMPNI